MGSRFRASNSLKGERLIELLGVEPPRSVEAIESPSGLRGHGCGGTSARDPNLSDAADHAPEDSGEGTNRPALHYAGPEATRAARWSDLTGFVRAI